MKASFFWFDLVCQKPPLCTHVTLALFGLTVLAKVLYGIRTFQANTAVTTPAGDCGLCLDSVFGLCARLICPLCFRGHAAESIPFRRPPSCAWLSPIGHCLFLAIDRSGPRGTRVRWLSGVMAWHPFPASRACPTPPPSRGARGLAHPRDSALRC
jgi:hypothetical protein